MTVFGFMKYSIDVDYQEFTIYDVDKGENVFVGTLNECPEQYEQAEICSFDTINKYAPILTLNVTLEQ